MVTLGGHGLAGQEPTPAGVGALVHEAPKADVKPDPNAIGAARAALGEENLQSLRYLGSGTVAMNSAGETDAPPRPVKSYDVLIDYPASTMQVDVVIEAAPAVAVSAGPLSHHVETINGALAWDADFVTNPVVAKAAHQKPPVRDSAASSVESRANTAAAPLRRQAIWITPHGFLKAALANQPALRSAGSGTEVSFYAGPHRYSGFLNSRHQVERVRTWVQRPELGDVLIDTTYTDYAVFGSITFPTRIRQLQNGRPVLDVTVTSVEANVPVHVAIPKNLSE